MTLSSKQTNLRSRRRRLEGLYPVTRGSRMGLGLVALGKLCSWIRSISIRRFCMLVGIHERILLRYAIFPLKIRLLLTSFLDRCNEQPLPVQRCMKPCLHSTLDGALLRPFLLSPRPHTMTLISYLPTRPSAVQRRTTRMRHPLERLTRRFTIEP